MKNYNKDNHNQDYLSLSEATEFCHYSQEYLSLRARQGKLKALKFGRNWVTKKEWLQEYFQRVEDYDTQIKKAKFKKKSVKGKTQPAPPGNLPVKKLIEIKFSLKDIRPTLATALVILLIIVGGISERETFIKGYNNISPYIEEIGKTGDFMIADAGQSILETLRDIESFSDDFYLAAVNYQDTSTFLSNVFKEYGQWIKNQILEIRIEDII
ncbi:hypothetical protein ES703_18329 [subsurface metagenome]